MRATIKLGSVTKKIGSGVTPRGGEKVYRTEGTALIRSQNVYDYRFVEDGLVYIDDTEAKRMKGVEIQKNDVLINITGDSVGRCCIVPEKVLPARVNQHVCILRADPAQLNSRYLMYYINEPGNKQRLLNQVHGGTRKALTKGILEAFEITIPSLRTQEKIAEILGSLDDKIELNRRMNETLEQMAMALYKHWFVDFGPFQDGEFVETELGMSIPNGWEICNFGDVSLNFNSRRIPLSNIQRQERKGSYPYYGAAGIIDFVDDYLYDGVFLLVGEDGSVMKDDGTPFLQYVEGKFWVNNHAHVIQGTNDVSTEWLMLHLKSTDISRYVTGAVQPKLSKGNLNSIPFVLPPTEIRKEFNNKIVSFFEQIRSNEKENKYLAETRDYLLPLLLSGEIEVREAEEQVEEVLANA